MNSFFLGSNSILLTVVSFRSLFRHIYQFLLRPITCTPPIMNRFISLKQENLHLGLLVYSMLS